MTKYSAAKAREAFSEIVDKTRHRGVRIIVTKHNKDVAAIVPIADLELLERLEDEADAREAKKARAEIKKSGTIPWERAKKQLRK